MLTLFSLRLIFTNSTLVAANISFSHHRNKIFMLFLSPKMSPVSFISRSSSLSLFFSVFHFHPLEIPTVVGQMQYGYVTNKSTP